MANKPEPKDKYALTVAEAASYFGIGEKKLREMTDDPTCQYVLWNGAKRLIKREKLEKTLDASYSI